MSRRTIARGAGGPGWRRATGVALAGVLAACSTPGLTPAGRRVVALGAPPIGHCRVLGMVTGEGGGLGGGFISNSNLVAYSMIDLRNNAAELGATHVYAQRPELGYTAGQSGATTTSATATGTAYRCDGDPGDVAESGLRRGAIVVLPVAVAPAAPPAPAAQAAPASPDAERQIRATLTARRSDVLACVGRASVVVLVSYTATGEAGVALVDDHAGGVEEACVRAALGDALRVAGATAPGRVLHLVR